MSGAKQLMRMWLFGPDGEPTRTDDVTDEFPFPGAEKIVARDFEFEGSIVRVWHSDECRSVGWQDEPAAATPEN